MKVVMIGGSGSTGRAVIEEFKKDDSIKNISALLRREVFGDESKLKEEIVDFDNLDKSAGKITGDIAFSCLGTTLKAAGSKENQWKIDFDYQLNFAKIAKAEGVPVFVLISSKGAYAESGIFYMKLKGALEEEVKKLDFEHLLIFRPGPLVRPNTDRFNEKLSVPIIRFLNFFGLLKNYKPIDVRDLAKVMIKEAKSPQSGVRIYEPDDIFELVG